ncbi:hypothetical protein PENSPDRAFT_622643 [Peniophora sp. CONT]|nr:hypothetical protein PENSPDRAFT_622643 [Peniophora sp. CONT]
MAFTVSQGEMLSVIVEGILYGFSLFMFGVTLWVLIYRRTSQKVHGVIFAVACLLWILSTIRVIVDSIHVYNGFLRSPDPELYFSDTTKETFKNAIYELQTLLGDGILIYRCFVVWGDWRVIIFPCILWCAVAATGTHTVWSISLPLTTSANIFVENAHWILSFYILTLCCNAFSTGLLAYKLWQINSVVAQYRTSSLIPVIKLLVECGLLYTICLIVMIITYTRGSNSLFFIINITGQIIPITFYMIIIRAGLSRMSTSSNSTANHASLPSTAGSRRSRRQEVMVSIENFTATDADSQIALQKVDGKHDSLKSSV